MLYEIGMACDIGISRKNDGNQDAIKVVLPGMFNRKTPLLILADGMGGQFGGAIASNLVVEEIARQYKKAKTGNDVPAWLKSSIDAAHKAVRSRAKQDARLEKMGSTVAVVVLEGLQLHLANVGDSRIYLINARQIRQVSWDHSKVADMVRMGVITPEEMLSHPERNKLTVAISVPRQELEIYQQTLPLEQDDIILLCSDGLWGAISDNQIWTVVFEMSAQEAADKLVTMANAAGGPDNISVIIARRKDFHPR